MLVHLRFVVPCCFAVALLFLARPTGAAEPDAKTPAQPKEILIIRHAEKPKDGPNLSDQGKTRADKLIMLFEKSADRPNPLPKPDFIFAAKNTDESHRPLETVTPLAATWKMTPNSDIRDKDFDELVKELTNPKYAGKVVLICWHHGKMPKLAKALGAKGTPDPYPEEVFDRVWRITYDGEDHAAKFVNQPQKLLSGDSDK
jgi:hypothetical protein